MKIKEVKARKILNSKGEETIEVEVNGFKASIGNGTSTGKFEVNALPEDINKVIRNFNNISREILSLSFDNIDDLEKVERFLRAEDVSSDFKEIGGNLLVNLQLAILKAASEGKVYELLGGIKKFPLPIGNIIGGGRHAGINGADIQEFLIIPRAKTIDDAIFINAKFHSFIKDKIGKIDKTFNFGRDIEGAWCPTLNNYEVLDLLKKNKEKIEKEYKIKIDLGIDMAASGLWNGRKYQYRNYSRFNKKRVLSSKDQIAFVRKLISNYDLKYVEDPLHEEDFDGFKELKNEKAMIVGDDLTVTNIERVKKAQNSISAVIIKPNQIGSILKTKEVIDFAKSRDIKTVLSHRGGDTEDNILAHLAVGFGVDYIKTGIVGGERTSKLNELLRLNEKV